MSDRMWLCEVDRYGCSRLRLLLANQELLRAVVPVCKYSDFLWEKHGDVFGGEWDGDDRGFGGVQRDGSSIRGARFATLYLVFCVQVLAFPLEYLETAIDSNP